MDFILFFQMTVQFELGLGDNLQVYNFSFQKKKFFLSKNTSLQLQECQVGSCNSELNKIFRCQRRIASQKQSIRKGISEFQPTNGVCYLFNVLELKRRAVEEWH